MNFSPGESSAEQTQPERLPPLPQLWVGYLLGFATIIAELVAASLHPEMAKSAFPIPPLYLFLLLLVGWVYWLVCVYRYHEVMQRIPGWKHPISPARAVGFHFLLGYNLYWFYQVAARDRDVRELEVREARDEASNGGPYVFGGIRPAHFV